MLRTPRLALLLPLLLYAYVTQADTQPLDTITGAATAFAIRHAENAGFAEVSAEARTLDPRLRLPRCPAQLEAFSAQPQRTLGQTTVGVRCKSGDKPWTLYVGVFAAAYREIPVMATALPRGAIIGLSDLRFIRQPINQASQQIILDADQIVGKELKRPVAEGATLSQPMLKAPKIVKRGQQVTLVAQSDNGALQVKMAGKALADGAAGDRISVQNLSSGNSVQGIINDDGTVKVF